MNESEKLIKDQFDSLPLEIRESISRVPWRERVQSIAKREGLSEEKTTALETETLLMLYGLALPDDFSQNITREAQLDDETAHRITREVFDEVVVEIEKQYDMIEALLPKTKPSSEPIQKAATPVSVPITQATPRSAPDTRLEIMPEREVVPVSAPKVVPVATPSLGPTQPPVATPQAEQIDKPADALASILNNAAPKDIKLYPGDKDPYREPLE